MNDSALSKQALSKTLMDFAQTRHKIAPEIIQTPLLKLDHGDHTLYIKPECFQSIGSFKIRSGASALVNLKSEDLKNGIITASAGNFAQGLAQAASSRKIPLKVIAPKSASSVKISKLNKMGVNVKTVDFDVWWDTMITRKAQEPGYFIHPVSEISVILGNGGIGLELCEQLADIDNIIVPFGGGGLVSGIALAARLSGFKGKIIACEIETSIPLMCAKNAGRPVKVNREPSWVDGIGSNGVLNEMWPLLDKVVDEVITITHSEAASALRLLAQKLSIIAEGAGAVAVAAGLKNQFLGSKTVAILSGGNIDMCTFSEILLGKDTVY